MNMRNARKAIRKIAKRQCISEKEVVENIEKAISEAIREAREENNVEILSRWDEIPCVNEYPNAYELVSYLAKKVCWENSDQS